MRHTPATMAVAKSPLAGVAGAAGPRTLQASHPGDTMMLTQPYAYATLVSPLTQSCEAEKEHMLLCVHTACPEQITILRLNPYIYGLRAFFIAQNLRQQCVHAPALGENTRKYSVWSFKEKETYSQPISVSKQMHVPMDIACGSFCTACPACQKNANLTWDYYMLCV